MSSVRNDGTGSDQATPVAHAIHKHHTVVHTTSIDVKIMRLDKRQMTLSVFRQLKDESILDLAVRGKDTFILRGTPWGVVRYVWGVPHWATYHLVWQLGDHIRRMPLCLVSELDDYLGDPDKGEEFNWCRRCGEVKKDWCCGRTTAIRTRPVGQRRGVSLLHYICPVGLADLVTLAADGDVDLATLAADGDVDARATLTQRALEAGFTTDEIEFLDSWQEVADLLCGGTATRPSPSEVYQAFTKHLRTFEALDQLFIAV